MLEDNELAGGGGTAERGEEGEDAYADGFEDGVEAGEVGDAIV